jgi:hypothetical protein
MRIIFLFLFLTLKYVAAFSLEADRQDSCGYFVPFEGTWSGNLSFDTPGGSQSIACELIITYLPDEKTYTWLTKYFTAGEVIEKNYVIKCYDPAKGHFILDENNGIYLDAYLKGNNLISLYEVSDLFFHTEYEFENDKIIFQINFFPIKAQTTSGGNTLDIPLVNSFALSGTQRAVFTRKKN